MRTDGPSDEELYERWRHAPDAPTGLAAWAELYARHWEDLILFCERITRDLSAAEDCAQKAFERMLKPRPLEGTFKTYLYSVGHNIAVDDARLRVKSKPLGNGPIAHSDPSSAIVTLETSAAVGECLDRLPEEHRKFVLLRACQRLTLEEAKEALGWDLALSTCHKLYHKLLAALKRCLEE